MGNLITNTNVILRQKSISMLFIICLNTGCSSHIDFQPCSDSEGFKCKSVSEINYLITRGDIGQSIENTIDGLKATEVSNGNLKFKNEGGKIWIAPAYSAKSGYMKAILIDAPTKEEDIGGK